MEFPKKILLKSGEARTAYIRRRLGEDATNEEILAEINGPALYTGPEGQRWKPAVVQVLRAKLDARPAPPKDVRVRPKLDVPSEADIDEVKDFVPALQVPEEYEGVLTLDEFNAARLRAMKQAIAKRREAAMKTVVDRELLKLEEQASAAMMLGTAKGDLVDHTIDLGPVADRITINGRTYWHGHSYRLPRDVVAVMREAEQRTWQHEEEIHGNDNRTAYFRMRAIKLGGGEARGTGVSLGATDNGLGAKGLREKVMA